MRVNEDYQTWNVATEMDDPSSVLSFYRSALELRKNNLIFVSQLRTLVGFWRNDNNNVFTRPTENSQISRTIILRFSGTFVCLVMFEL